jgi:hypothetical protein
MNRDLLQALSALAVSCYCEARRCHPTLFLGAEVRPQGGDSSVTDEEHAVLLLVPSLDDLLQRLHDLLTAQEAAIADADAFSDLDDDIPY